MGKTKPPFTIPKIKGDLIFSRRREILEKYKSIFNRKVFDRLWSNIWEEKLLSELNIELRRVKLERILKNEK